ncbi:hypothetical protein BRADI_3g54493v3 [Brachypodium distachyon]|uniref:Uncharacterized protein n=1 Tax=Brachypodium distachyon TaxID=15368 RepID=A0A2K2D529_BRADI|nr:hypothetical protein BRADI_3g54493v3 [Brachypodium distachyon]
MIHFIFLLLFYASLFCNVFCYLGPMPVVVPFCFFSLLCLLGLVNLRDNDEKHEQNTPSFGTDWHALRAMLSNLQF